MRDFVIESLRDLSIGLVVGAVIALLIEGQATTGSVVVLGLGFFSWFAALAAKSSWA